MSKLLDPKISNLGNIFKFNQTNLIILIIIILILLLIYLNTNKIDLFYTNPPDYSNSVSQFLASLRQQQQQLSKYQTTMASQNIKITGLADQVANLINESA